MVCQFNIEAKRILLQTIEIESGQKIRVGSNRCKSNFKVIFRSKTKLSIFESI